MHTYSILSTARLSYHNMTTLHRVGTPHPQALEFRTPLFPHLVPPAIMEWIFFWKYIFEPLIHILQHFVLQLSRSTNYISNTAAGPRNKS
jgi:hypothetical protein